MKVRLWLVALISDEDHEAKFMRGCFFEHAASKIDLYLVNLRRLRTFSARKIVNCR